MTDEARQIAELCTRVGAPARAAGFILDGASMADVTRALTEDGLLEQPHQAASVRSTINAEQMWDKAFAAARAAHATGYRND